MKDWKKKFKRWLVCAGIRALKTTAQTAGGILATCAVLSDIDWKVILSSSIVAGLFSLCTSIGGLPELKMDESEEENIEEAVEEGEQN